jgi:[ribosomal protein S5]-alanine N-acetyltransferase
VIELKPVQPTDGELIFGAWGSHPENFAYLTARVFSDVADADRYVAELFSTPESFAFHIVEPAGGIVGIVKAAVSGHRAQIGYVVHQPFWGRGFATAAVQRVTEMVEALPQISRVWATCALENPASVRVLEKCGYEREAILKNWVIYPAQGRRAFDNYSYVKLPRSAR